MSENSDKGSELDRLLSLQAGLAHLMPPLQDLGPLDEVSALESERLAMKARAGLFIQRLADLLTSGNPRPILLFQQLTQEARHLFGDRVSRVLAHHCYSGSGSGIDAALLEECTHIDFPSPFNIEGENGVVSKVLGAFPQEFEDFTSVLSSQSSPQGAVLQISASLREEFGVRLGPNSPL